MQDLLYDILLYLHKFGSQIVQMQTSQLLTHENSITTEYIIKVNLKRLKWHL
jgi:hypothetical protein